MPWPTAGPREAYIGICPMPRPKTGTTSTGLHVASLRLKAIEGRPCMDLSRCHWQACLQISISHLQLALSWLGSGSFSCPCMIPILQPYLCWQPQQTPSSVTLVPVICSKWPCAIPAVNGIQQAQGALPVYAPEAQAAISPTASRHFLL